jgi:hypothetical protein
MSHAYTARSYRLSHRGQVTDRFTKASERLSSPDVDARLGGSSTLPHVANDSRPHHDDVVEVSEAFIHRRAPATAWPGCGRRTTRLWPGQNGNVIIPAGPGHCPTRVPLPDRPPPTYRPPSPPSPAVHTAPNAAGSASATCG